MAHRKPSINRSYPAALNEQIIGSKKKKKKKRSGANPKSFTTIFSIEKNLDFKLRGDFSSSLYSVKYKVQTVNMWSNCVLLPFF